MGSDKGGPSHRHGGWRAKVPPHTLSYDRYEQVYGITTPDGRSLTFWEPDEQDTLLLFALGEGAVSPEEVRDEAVVVLRDRSVPSAARARGAREIGIIDRRADTREPGFSPATPALCEALNDERDVVAAAVGALTAIEDPRAAEALYGLASSGGAGLDAWAALATVGDARAVAPLTAFAHENIEQLQHAERALIRTKDRTRDDAAERYRLRAASALARSNLAQCKQSLRKLGDAGASALAAVDEHEAATMHHGPAVRSGHRAEGSSIGCGATAVLLLAGALLLRNMRRWTESPPRSWLVRRQG